MNVPHLIRIKCRRCHQSRHPHEFIGGPVVGYCTRCYENHRLALDVLAGDIPKGCVDCGVSTQSLSESQPGNDIRMSVVMKDGLYAVLCSTCADRYEQSNKELFRGTAYGAAKRI